MPDDQWVVDDADWLRYALQRIHRIVDKPRAQMTEDEFTIFTFAQNALALGEPVIAAPARGAGARLCRVCLAEWTYWSAPDHVHACPVGARGRPISD